MRGLQRLAGKPRRFGIREVPQRLLLSLLLRLTRNGSFARLLADTHGRARPAPTGGDFLGERVLTDDGKIHLAPAEFIGRAAELDAAYRSELADPRSLRLITRRHVKTHNSWTHNDDAFAREGETNYLYLHPQDAERLRLSNGDVADVRSSTATIRLPVKTLPDLQPGTAALPHGWGHQHALGLTAASRTTGVNVNLLAADGPKAVDKSSGMAHLTGIPVEVTPAAGPRDVASWSGIGAR